MARQGYMFRLTITIMIVLLIITYAVFNTRLIFKGPTVQFYDLRDGQIIEGDGLLEIRGAAQNVSYISLNGRQIFIDEKSHQFSEKVLLTSHINSFEVFVSDKFGKEDYKKITLVYKDHKQIDISLPKIEATSTQEEATDNT
jgi:hypothetical protein